MGLRAFRILGPLNRGAKTLESMIGYLAPKGLENYLKKELSDICYEYGRLVIAKGPLQKVYWAQNIWLAPEILTITSISDAARKLRQRQKLWSLYPHTCIRRAHLIQEKLPYFQPKPYTFPASPPNSPLGAWTLLDEKTLLLSSTTTSPFPQGEVHFVETKAPPSRAYLKLWEALTRAQAYPNKGDVCLEVGASPGSWTWVLQSLGAKVIAVDRAPLASSIDQRNLTFLQKDAFSLTPQKYPEVQWIFSDLICFPEKLLKWIQLWLEANPKINFVCTLKFQGEPSAEIIDQFAEIEKSQVVHLFHNKHELTWLRIPNP